MANDNFKVAITSRASEPYPDEFHTLDEYEALMEETRALRERRQAQGRNRPTARAARPDDRADLVTTALNHREIWARWNAQGGAIQRAKLPVATDEE